MRFSLGRAVHEYQRHLVAIFRTILTEQGSITRVPQKGYGIIPLLAAPQSTVANAVG